MSSITNLVTCYITRYLPTVSCYIANVVYNFKYLLYNTSQLPDARQTVTVGHCIVDSIWQESRHEARQKVMIEVLLLPEMSKDEREQE